MIVLVKFAVIVVFCVIVPEFGVQPSKIVVWPSKPVGVAVTVCPSENASKPPNVGAPWPGPNVVPYGTDNSVLDTVPYPFVFIVTVYLLIVLVKFAVIVVSCVIVPEFDDQVNELVYPVCSGAVAVTVCPLENL